MINRVKPVRNRTQAGIGDTIMGKIHDRWKNDAGLSGRLKVKASSRGPLQPAAQGSDHRAAGGVLFLRGLEQVLALDAQPHGDRSGDEYR